MTEAPGKVTVTEVDDSLQDRAKELGLPPLADVVALPRGFFWAKDVSELAHDFSASDVRILLRSSNVELQIPQPQTGIIPTQQNRSAEWFGPCLAFAGLLLQTYPNLLPDTIKKIREYVTTAYNAHVRRISLSVVVEQTKTKKSVKLDYEGPAEDLDKLLEAVKQQVKADE